ncbi:tetratricopeptide repeat protein [Streptomyces anulatus]|uniref:tetratricopeptide repeat protein n=1 Tax=Streptomyces anulatus TaxID=1892 RepID=UPI0038678570
MGAEREAPGTSNTISGGQQENVVMAREISGPVTFTTAGRRVPAYLQDPLRWPLAGDWGALAAGARRARPDDSGDAVPPYVPRDRDPLIRTRLTRAADEGGMVLVVGNSTAGKTRTCFEALRAQLPEYRVVAPTAGLDLMTAVEVIDRTGTRCVVWLDDLERYLGSEGLDPGLLAELVRLRIPVLATMRHQEFDVFAAPEDASEAGTEPARSAISGARVLRQLDAVELDRVWSPDELERAGEADDDRIADALAHHGPYGIAEYLAAGPALFQEWHRAARPGGHPRAAALIAAAVDLARTGLRPPYPLNLLTDAHEPYLAAAGGPLLRPESLDKALKWATRRRHGVTSLLVPTQDPNAWDVFDYLTDHTHAPVPDATWHTALRHTTDTDDLAIIGFHAHYVAPGIAEASYRRAIDAGHVGAMVNLGVLLAGAGRKDEAERFHRRAADTGHTDAMNNLALLLDDVGRTDEAEVFLRRAADTGHAEAMNNLGVLLLRAGHTDEAELMFRRAADTGHLGGVSNLGALLEDLGHADEAEVLLRRAANAGHVHAVHILGALLVRAGRTDEAEHFYRQAADTGHPESMFSLGVLLVRAGCTDEAEHFYRQAADTGHVSAMINLGALLSELGRIDEAECVFRRAAANGNRRATNSLGVLLHRTGRIDEAERCFRQAADAGDTGAMNNLAVLLLELHHTDEAESYFRQAVDGGYPDAVFNLGALLHNAGRTDEAMVFFRQAIEAGSPHVLFNLGVLLRNAGQADAAEVCFRKAVEAGHLGTGPEDSKY